VNALLLLKAWEQRDRRYAVRRTLRALAPLSEREEAAVRANRRLEIFELRPSDRAAALEALGRWAPPRVAK